LHTNWFQSNHSWNEDWWITLIILAIPFSYTYFISLTTSHLFNLDDWTKPFSPNNEEPFISQFYTHGLCIVTKTFEILYGIFLFLFIFNVRFVIIIVQRIWPSALRTCWRSDYLFIYLLFTFNIVLFYVLRKTLCSRNVYVFAWLFYYFIINLCD